MEVFKSSQRQLGATVGDLMTREVFTLLEDDNIEVLDELLHWRNIRHVPVVNDAREIVGLITHRDLLRIAVSELASVSEEEKRGMYRKIQIRTVMGHKVKVVSPNMDLSAAAKIMVHKKYGCLPVCEKGKLVGIITEADFVKAFANY